MGGLVRIESGIGGAGSTVLRHAHSSYRSVFGTSLTGAKPPAMSPYSVE